MRREATRGDGAHCGARLRDPLHSHLSGRRRLWPGLLLYTDIFQLTESTLRTARRLAAHGFVVCVPEIYPRSELAGVALEFDDAGKQAGMAGAAATTTAQFDADRVAALDYLEQRGASWPFRAGFCIGGHLAFRAAFDPRVKATVCFYPTGLPDGKLGADADAGTLASARDIRGRLHDRLRFPGPARPRRRAAACRSRRYTPLGSPTWNCTSMPAASTRSCATSALLRSVRTDLGVARSRRIPCWPLTPLSSAEGMSSTGERVDGGPERFRGFPVESHEDQRSDDHVGGARTSEQGGLRNDRGSNRPARTAGRALSARCDGARGRHRTSRSRRPLPTPCSYACSIGPGSRPASRWWITTPASGTRSSRG